MTKGTIYSMKLHLKKEEYPNKFLKSDLRLLCEVLADERAKPIRNILFSRLRNMGYNNGQIDTIAKRLNMLKNNMLRESTGELI